MTTEIEQAFHDWMSRDDNELRTMPDDMHPFTAVFKAGWQAGQARAAMQAQEPVAYRVEWSDIGEGIAFSLFYDENAKFYMEGAVSYGMTIGRSAKVIPLYAAPPSPPPLTDGIFDMLDECLRLAEKRLESAKRNFSGPFSEFDEASQPSPSDAAHRVKLRAIIAQARGEK